MKQNYKNAFNCKRCPGSNNAQGCPMWWETVYENVQNGETKVIASCGFTQLPLYLTEVVRASNRPAAAVQSMRNEHIGQMVRLVDVFNRMFDQNAQLEGKGNGTPRRIG